MQIKVGGVYFDREGRKVVITGQDGRSPEHPFVSSTSGRTFAENGSWGSPAKEHPYDLIAEWTDEPTAVEKVFTQEGIDAALAAFNSRYRRLSDESDRPMDIRAVEEAVAASRRDAPEPDPCDYRESAETLAAALRVFLRAMPETSPVNDPLIDAAAFARLALDGYAP